MHLKGVHKIKVNSYRTFDLFFGDKVSYQEYKFCVFIKQHLKITQFEVHQHGI